MLEGNTEAPFPVVAIDGNAACGKGSLARGLARKFGFAYLDTGVAYRLVGLRMLDNGCHPTDEKSAIEFAKMLRRTFDHHQIAETRLKTDEVSRMTSRIAAIDAVRSEVREIQRDFYMKPPALPDGSSAKGAVLDGRDIGTTVCPDAPVKFFVTAAAETRAFRRFRELQQKGFMGTYESVLAEIQSRDESDTSRTHGSMKHAPDAMILDTTKLSAPETLAVAVTHMQEKLKLAAVQ